MVPMFTFQDIDLICFDVFGTLIEIAERRRPFAHLRRRMSAAQAVEFRRLMMTTRMSLDEIESILKTGASVTDLVLARILMAGEVASVQLRPGIREMLDGLPVPYVVCSNLSADYVPALRHFSEIRPVFEVLSCDLGCMKPDPEIYDIVIMRSSLLPERILFVGDTPEADIEGPRKAGMKAMHIDELLALQLR